MRHLELVKDKNKWLEDQLAEEKKYTPDVLAQRLAERLRLSTVELERLNADQTTNQKTLKDKEIELAELRIQIVNFKAQVEKAQALLDLISNSGLVCPKCGAPLSIRDYHDEIAEYNGYDIDIEHELIIYECGYKIVNGQVISECKKNIP